MKHLYIIRSAGLGKIFCNFRNNPMVLLIFFDMLNVLQMLTYYLTFILNYFSMMSEKHCHCRNVKEDDKLSLVF